MDRSEFSYLTSIIRVESAGQLDSIYQLSNAAIKAKEGMHFFFKQLA